MDSNLSLEYPLKSEVEEFPSSSPKHPEKEFIGFNTTNTDCSSSTDPSFEVKTEPEFYDFSEDDNNHKKVYHYAKIPVLYDRHTCS